MSLKLFSAYILHSYRSQTIFWHCYWSFPWAIHSASEGGQQTSTANWSQWLHVSTLNPRELHRLSFTIYDYSIHCYILFSCIAMKSCAAVGRLILRRGLTVHRYSTALNFMLSQGTLRCQRAECRSQSYEQHFIFDIQKLNILLIKLVILIHLFIHYNQQNLLTVFVCVCIFVSLLYFVILLLN